MIAYIRTGIDRNHHLLIIEYSTLYNEVDKSVIINMVNTLFSLSENDSYINSLSSTLNPKM